MTKYFSLIFLLFGCSSQRKYLNYKETIATIIDYDKLPATNDIVSGLISGSMVNTNDYKWTNYTFTVKRRIEESSDYENQTMFQYYDFTISGQASSRWEIGEKFIVKYDPKKYDNDHNYLIYYRPIFLDNEKTVSSKGKILKIHGKDKINGEGIGITFEYLVIPPISNLTDSLSNHFTKYQYLPPETNIDSLKTNMTKEYKVLYSVENSKRAILYLKN